MLFRSDAGLKLCETGREDVILASAEGEMLFTDKGLSGPVVLQLAGRAGPGRKHMLIIDLLPGYSADGLEELLLFRQKHLSSRSVISYLEGLLPDRIARAFIEERFPAADRQRISSLSKDDIHALAAALKKIRAEIKGTEGWKEAQMTAGGVLLGEIDTESMGSVLMKGIYLTGELLDVTGDCGGFNLQFAWATGHLAGRCAASSAFPKAVHETVISVPEA